MKKIFSLALALMLALIFSLCACNIPMQPNEPSDTGDKNATASDALARPETNLEFWIAENVDGVDFSKYQEKFGMMGGEEYYGEGYIPTLDEHEQQVDPERCVIYTVTSYPDYSNKEKHVTGIYITDPAVEFAGISLSSSFEDFERFAEAEGFEIAVSNENGRVAKMGKYSITFTKECIGISVEIENKNGIIF